MYTNRIQILKPKDIKLKYGRKTVKGERTLEALAK